MVVVVGDDRVESSVIKVITRVDGSIRGILDEDARVCVTGNGGVQ